MEIWKCVWDDLGIKNRTGARRNDWRYFRLLSIARRWHCLFQLTARTHIFVVVCSGGKWTPLTVAGLAFGGYGWRPGELGDLLHWGFWGSLHCQLLNKRIKKRNRSLLWQTHWCNWTDEMHLSSCSAFYHQLPFFWDFMFEFMFVCLVMEASS